MNYPTFQYSGIKNKPWTLTEDFYIELPNGHTMLIPKGYWTDMASVPKVFRLFGVDFIGKDHPAFLVHDYMYNFGGYKIDPDFDGRTQVDVKRDFADYTMRWIQKEYGASLFRRWSFWKVVRVGGLFRFRKI